MFSKIMTKRYMKDYSPMIEKLKMVLKDCDAILIGAGSGVSTAAGFTYSGTRFEKYFSDFAKKYGIRDMYSGGFYPFSTQEEYWAYWSRYIFINRYQDALNPVYENLLKLVQDKDYFVITTNVDHCFQKAGFDKKRLFYTQGDYGLFQCSEPCCEETFDNEDIILQMVNTQKNGKVSSDLIPFCPHCKKPLIMNLRCDEKFVQDKGFYEAAKPYKDFLNQHEGQKILFLELGVGFNTPAIIKYPFWKMASENTKAIYACVNLEQSSCPNEIWQRSICLDQDIGKVLVDLLMAG